MANLYEHALPLSLEMSYFDIQLIETRLVSVAN